jgi:hypothetical protein
MAVAPGQANGAGHWASAANGRQAQDGDLRLTTRSPSCSLISDTREFRLGSREQGPGFPVVQAKNRADQRGRCPQQLPQRVRRGWFPLPSGTRMPLASSSNQDGGLRSHHARRSISRILILR